MTTIRCVVELGGAARALRRSLGPVAWAVLEDLATDARSADAGCGVETNVRRVAANVGISKDTAARALRRLINAQLVTRAPSRRGERGEFATVSYKLHVDRVTALSIRARTPATDTIDESVTPIPQHDAPKSTRRRDVDAAQVSLFDEATD